MASFFLSGINHCELHIGQQLTQDHLRALQQQVAENAERARALQQLQQQAQQGIRAVSSVKTEPGAQALMKKEEGGSQAQQSMVALQPQQLQALLALQLQQRAAAVAAQQQAQEAAGGRAAASTGGPSGLPVHASHQHGKQGKGSDEAAETDQWVQCSKCMLWRQVPDEFWPEFENADEDEDWYCKDSLWDVQEYEPHNPPCC